MTKTVMLLAAGRGERLRPLTDTLPKALVAVAGTSLLERHLLRLAAQDVSTVVINLGWQGEKIVERIGSGRQFGLQVVYSPEYDNILETGGGILRALPLLGDEPFWVLNADVLTDWELPASVLADDVQAQLVLVPNPPYREQGDFSLQGNRVQNEEPRTLTFSGIGRYRPEFFNDCSPGRFGLAPLLRAAAERKELAGDVYEGLWADVGTPERLAAAEARFQAGATAE